MNSGASAAIPSCQLKVPRDEHAGEISTPLLSRCVKENQIASPNCRGMLFALVKHYDQRYGANARIVS
jgi:hypothetical protein